MYIQSAIEILTHEIEDEKNSVYINKNTLKITCYLIIAKAKRNKLTIFPCQ